MPSILIADDVSEECPRILREHGFDVTHLPKPQPDELISALASAEGLIVRSAVKVTRELIDAGRRLRVIGRAGIGVDNVDVGAATRRGILVMNTPQGNVAAAAEHTFALLMALARNVVAADASVRAGKWERSRWTGVEVSEKTLGIAGLGNVGSIVARFALQVPMKVAVFDPFVTQDRAREMGIRLVTFDELLAEADFITIHVPLTDKTRGLFGAREFAKMKPTARIVNAARGGIVDEKALVEALKERRIAGAALDVFETEPPPKDHPLFALANTVLTPHLGASTVEAQHKVAEDVARQFVDYFTRGVVRNAVNHAAVGDPAIAPYLRLASDLGGITAQVMEGGIRKIEIHYSGEIARGATAAVTASAVRGVLAPALGEAVNTVNALVLARERGIGVEERKTLEGGDHRSRIEVRLESEAGVRSAAGTVLEGRDPRVVGLDGTAIDLRPSRDMLLLAYPDVPGVVGRCGTVLGRRGVNIARMEVGRTGRGRDAVMVLTLDDPATAEVIGELRAVIPEAKEIRAIRLA